MICASPRALIFGNFMLPFRIRFPPQMDCLIIQSPNLRIIIAYDAPFQVIWPETVSIRTILNTDFQYLPLYEYLIQLPRCSKKKIRRQTLPIDETDADYLEPSVLIY